MIAEILLNNWTAIVGSCAIVTSTTGVVLVFLKFGALKKDLMSKKMDVDIFTAFKEEHQTIHENIERNYIKSIEEVNNNFAWLRSEFMDHLKKGK